MSRRGGRNKGGVSRCEQTQTNANKRRQTSTNASKRRGENASKRKQTQANASKRGQTQTNANKRLHPPLLRFFTPPLQSPYKTRFHEGPAWGGETHLATQGWFEGSLPIVLRCLDACEPQVIKFMITGHMAPIHGAPKGKTIEEVLMLAVEALVQERKSSPKSKFWGRISHGHPRGYPSGRPGAKTSVRPLKSWKKTSILVRTSMTRRRGRP